MPLPARILLTRPCSSPLQSLAVTRAVWITMVRCGTSFLPSTTRVLSAFVPPLLPQLSPHLDPSPWTYCTCMYRSQGKYRAGTIENVLIFAKEILIIKSHTPHHPLLLFSPNSVAQLEARDEYPQWKCAACQSLGSLARLVCSVKVSARHSRDRLRPCQRG